MAARQLPAASRDSCALNWTCINFSAARKVAAETSGPTGGDVANAEGAPGGGAVTGTPLCAWAASYPPRVAPTTLKEALVRKRLREFFKGSPEVRLILVGLLWPAGPRQIRIAGSESFSGVLPRLALGVPCRRTFRRRRRTLGCRRRRARRRPWCWPQAPPLSRLLGFHQPSLHTPAPR